MSSGKMRGHTCHRVTAIRTPESRRCEGRERVLFAVVDREEGQEVGEAQRLRHAVLRLEQPERCAVAVRHPETLYEIAEAAAVDVLHLGEIEEDLLVAFSEQFIDDLRQ